MHVHHNDVRSPTKWRVALDPRECCSASCFFLSTLGNEITFRQAMGSVKPVIRKGGNSQDVTQPSELTRSKCNVWISKR